MYLLPATKFTRLHLIWSVINWSRVTAADILRDLGGRGRRNWLFEVHRSSSRTREPSNPRIRNIQAELFRSRDSFSPSSRVSSARASTECVLSDRECSWRIMGRRNDEAAVLQIFFSPLLSSSLQVRSSVGYADIVSSKGLSLAHLEATRVATNVSRIMRDFNNVKSPILQRI